LQNAKQVIIIQDREGDIYDQLSTVPDEKHHLLIRSRCNRHLTDGGLLWDTLSKRKARGTYNINVEGDKRKEINKRKTTIYGAFITTGIISSLFSFIFTKPRGCKR